MKTSAALIFLLLSVLAIVQPASTTADRLATAEIPASTCAQPVTPPRIRPRPEDLDRFDHQLAAYRECVEQYIKARSGEIKHDNALARANADAANAVVQKLNDLMKQIQDNATSP